MPASNKYMAHIHELLNKDPKFLTSLEKQEVYVAKIHMQQRTCPYCDRKFNLFEAVDSEDYEDDELGKTYHCPGCDERIVRLVPFMNNGIVYTWGKYLSKWPGADDRKVIGEE